MDVSKDITIKDDIKQNFLEIYSQSKLEIRKSYMIKLD